MLFKTAAMDKKAENKFFDEKINAENLKKVFSGCNDFQLREVWPGGKKIRGVSICWIEGLASGAEISERVLRPLCSPFLEDTPNLKSCRELLSRGGIYFNAMTEKQLLSELCYDLCLGSCAVVFDELKSALSFDTNSPDKRAISEPTAEKTVKGPKDSFVEILRTNTTLVRRRIRDPELKLIQKKVGRRSGTQVGVMYMDGIANVDFLEELLHRLDSIDIDGLLEAGELEQYIVDAPWSPFPQMIHTERPDIFAGHLLSGRIGLIIDGLPIGFIVPATLSHFMRVGEDKAQHFISASMLMLLRWLSLMITVFLPAAFVAVSMYHQEMIPMRLLMSMISAKQDVPFSVALEVLSMLVAFELLLEAGVRLPDPVGDTVSIIGALIVGQSAVEAKVVSPIAVIVVAIAGICGFTQPSRDMSSALRITRFLLVLLSIALGMYGLMLGAALLVYHLCSIDSFSVSYTAPMSEGGFLRSIRSFFQVPLWKLKYRDPELKTPDKRRQK